MNKLLIAIVAVISIATGFLLYQKSFNLAQPEHSLFYQTPRTIKPFAMVDHQGTTFANEQLIGKWSWVFFGYTSCPDVCPTTLQELNFVYDELKAINENAQVLLVSVDPQRDTVEKLAQYIAYFNQEFKALTADHSVLFPFARNLGLMYAISDEKRDDNYLVDHSASIVLINPEGKIAAIFKPEHELGQLPIISGDNLVSDFAKIVNLSE
ncbi:SCO family protein [Colwellia sp. 1_MG-2023]|uniref:SCO family protein n=1 Tax=Colwellia sp. 1_MG-2023 TaxID=3062649 RepID=UPI0026E18F37|nr:SCO family protein [Colwellia sp. 1_MG-2023]MDO6445399.1 SCO family protein [Colwellia sp. 1_MG-2023]